MRLLIVEDEKRLADTLAKGLAAEGFATDVAYDGIDGLHRARTTSYDLILLDVMLPGLNGYRLCSTLRADGDDTPVRTTTCASRSRMWFCWPAFGHCCDGGRAAAHHCCESEISSSIRRGAAAGAVIGRSS